MKTHYLMIIALLSVFFSACAAEEPPSRPNASDTTTPVVGTEAATPIAPVGTVDFSELSPLPPITDEPQEMPMPGIPDPGRYLASKVRQDLAERLGVDVSAIAVIEQEAVDWPDSSLGCPQEGMAYLTVITPGYRIVLEAEGKLYAYHTDLKEQIVYCAGDRPAP